MIHKKLSYIQYFMGGINAKYMRVNLIGHPVQIVPKTYGTVEIYTYGTSRGGNLLLLRN